MYTDVPAEDQGASNYVLKLPTTNAGVGHRHFEMAAPVMMDETSSNSTAQDEHGMQSNQAVSNWELSTLSPTLRVEKSSWRHGSNAWFRRLRCSDGRTGGSVPAIALLPNHSTAPTTQAGMVVKRSPTKQVPKQNHTETRIYSGARWNVTSPGKGTWSMKKFLVQYHKSERSEKIKVSQQVVDDVHAWGGRFLKRVMGSNEYVEVSNKIARTRVSQALRDGKESE
jgi:hypothetical protein